MRLAPAQFGITRGFFRLRFTIGEHSIEFESPVLERSTNIRVFVAQRRQEFWHGTDVPQRGVGKIILAPLPDVTEPKPGTILRRPNASRRPQECSGWRVVIALNNEGAV